MVADPSPEVLPAGWTVQFNVLKTGRKIKHYVNSETGQKFFSKDAVVQYVKAQSPELDLPQVRKRPVKSDSKDSLQMHLVVKDTNECPEWLPHGWIVELKTRNSGASSGIIYKCYVDLSTGSRFYSKPQVFKYLRHVKRKSRNSKQKETSLCLPPTSNVQIEKSKMEDIPPGWIKELKITETARRIRKDWYYTDPVSGIVFRSRREVQRYLQTGEIGRRAKVPKNRHTDDQSLSSSTAKRKKLNQLAERGQLLAGKASSDSTGGMLPVASMNEIPPCKCSEDDVVDINAESEENSKSSLSAVEDSNGDEGKKVSADNDIALTPGGDVRQKQSCLRIETRSSSQQKTQGSLRKPKNEKVLNLPRRTSKRLKGLEPNLEPNSVSSTQALRNAITTRKSEHIQVNEDTDDGPLLMAEAYVKQEENSVDNKMKGSSTRKVKNSSTKSDNNKGDDLPRRTSKRLAGLKPEPVPSSASGGQALQNARNSFKGETKLIVDLTSGGLAAEVFQQHKAASRAELLHHASADADNPLHGEPSKPRWKSLYHHDIPEGRSRGLETDNISDEKSEAMIPPFEEFWKDPCLEFAFKTLTGVIPVEDAAYNVLISTPPADILHENVLPDRTEDNSNGKTPTSSSKSRKRKENNLPRRSSKRHCGLQLKPMTNSISKESAICISAKKSSKTGAVDAALASNSFAEEASQQPGVRPGIKRLHHHGFADNKVSPKWPSYESKEPLAIHTVSKEQSRKSDLLQPSFSEGDYWSDPCHEFAFKTLTSSIPVNSNLPVHSYFQQQVNTGQARKESYFQQQVETNQTQRNGNWVLPDFGSPGIFQSDISAHFEFPDNQQPASQPCLPLNNPLLLPSTNLSLPSCSTIASQPPSLEGNKGLSRKVDS